MQLASSLPTPALSAGRRDRWLSAVFAAIAAVCLSHAANYDNGAFHSDAMPWLVGALLATLIAVVDLSRLGFLERHGPRAALPILVLVVAFQMWGLFGTTPMVYASRSILVLAEFHQWMVLLAVFAFAVPAMSPRVQRYSLLLIVVVHAGITMWLLGLSPRPRIDVYVQAQAACEAFSNGVNPYTITFPNIYGEEAARFYAPGAVQNDVVQFGYSYMPLNFYPAYLSWKLTGDVRYSNLVAVGLSALLIGWIGREPFGRLAMLLMLFMGMTLKVTELAWVDPIVVLCLAATVACAFRWPRLLPWMLGLLLVSKQHMFLAAAPALLLTDMKPRSIFALAWRAALSGAIVTLPLALWDWQAFWRGAVWVHMNSPFREEAMSLAAWYYLFTNYVPPRGVEFVAAGVGIALALWRAPRTPAGFALGVAATYLPMFAFGKQAFANYWFFVVATLAIAVAATARGKLSAVTSETLAPTTTPPEPILSVEPAPPAPAPAAVV